MKMFVIAAACVIGLAMAGSADAADNKVVKTPAKVLSAKVLVMPGSDRMLNPQPLPPRWMTSPTVNPLIRYGLNPQPLPPNPPDPYRLRAIQTAPLMVR